jgi:hypothetical protein
MVPVGGQEIDREAVLTKCEDALRNDGTRSSTAAITAKSGR